MARMIPGSVVLLFVFCMVPLRLAADGNDPLFENFDVSDGLPHNTVQKIFQDSAGFMWFATKDGLCRYDGQTCLSYRESLSHKSISNSKIRCMAEDAGKCIWVGTDNGLNRIDPAVGDIRSFFSSGEPLLKSDRINDLYFDSGTGFMWIATDRGVSIYDTGSDSFVPVGSCRAFDSETNILLVADKVYIGTAHGLYECDRYAGRPASLGDGTDFAVFSILKDRNGDVWFGNDHTFLGKVPCGKTAAEFMFPDRQRSGDGSDVYSIIERDGVLWLVTRRNGIFLYDGVSGNLQGPFHPEPSGNTMLTCGYKDADGNMRRQKTRKSPRPQQDQTAFERSFPQTRRQACLSAQLCAPSQSAGRIFFCGVRRMYFEAPQTGKIDLTDVFFPNVRYLRKHVFKPYLKMFLMRCVLFYQRRLSKGTCLYRPTCSQYMMESLNNNGVVIGLALGIWRLLRCNPFSRGGYDPAKENLFLAIWLI